MKRIVIASNYDTETFDESWLNVPPMSEDKAKEVCEFLNQIDPDGERYYKPRDLDYKLYKFEP